MFEQTVAVASLSASGSSEDQVGIGVDLLESDAGALVEDTLGGQALIFIVVVCVHAGPEVVHLVLAESLDDGLARRALVLPREAILFRLSPH